MGHNHRPSMASSTPMTLRSLWPSPGTGLKIVIRSASKTTSHSTRSLFCVEVQKPSMMKHSLRLGGNSMMTEAFVCIIPRLSLWLCSSVRLLPLQRAVALSSLKSVQIDIFKLLSVEISCANLKKTAYACMKCTKKQDKKRSRLSNPN